MDRPANTFTSYGFDKNGIWAADYPPTWLEPGYDDGYGGTNLVTATDDDAEMSFTFALGAGATWDGRWQFLVDGSKYTLGTESDPGDWLEDFFGDYGTGGGILGNMGAGFSGSNILALDATPDSLYVKPAETVTVKLNQRYLAQKVAGYQAFVSFDPAKLGFSTGTYTSSPYELEIITPISAVSGDIDLAAGTTSPTSEDAELADLTFTAGSTEGATQVVFRAHDPATLFTDDLGEPIPPTLIDSALIVIDGTNPEVTVTAPNGGEYLKGGASTTITWTATDANMDPNSIAIDYWDGSSWQNIATGEANDGSYTWNPIPSLDINTAKVRVTATDLAGNSASDESDAAFTIDSSKPTIDNIKLTVASDGSGTDLTPSGTAIQGTYYVSAYVSDNLAGIDWSVLPTITVTDSASNSLVTGAVTADQANGRFYVQITVTASSANGTANIGVSGVMDRSGNVSLPASDTFIVNKTQAVVTVQLAGVTTSPQRWIKFVIGGSAGAGQRLVITRQVSFTAGTGTVTFTDLPANANWTKISAKDEQHTLRKLADLVDTGDRQYSATLVLQGGDATNDNLIDIRDFGVFAGQWGTTPDPNSTWPAKNANFDCDGSVGTPDFTFIQIGFLSRGDAEPSYAETLSMEIPLTSVSVAEMKKLIGMPAARKADVNGDGVIDLTDIKLFLQSNVRRGR